MSNRPENIDARLEQLIRLVIQNDATERDAAELEARLQASAEARRYYCRALEVHANLHWLYRPQVESRAPQFNYESGAEVDAAATVGLSKSLGSVMPPRTRRFWITDQRRVLAYAATLLLLLTGGVLYRRLQQQAQAPDIDRTPGITVATLHSAKHCVWGGATQSLTSGAKFKSGSRLQLFRGTAEMRFGSGAAVVIDSPAEFELLTANSMRLKSGTIAARVNGPVKDFLVEVKDSSIIDRGTSFGVHCEQDQPTQLEVFEGAVEVFAANDDKKAGQLLEFGSSVQIGNKGNQFEVEKIASKPELYDDLLERLWDDIQIEDSETVSGLDDGTLVKAEFTDATTSGAIDAFYNASRGRGWVTPWLAVGNPMGHVATLNSLAGENNPYLKVSFLKSNIRTIARAYGSRPGFNPREPHLISWTWRFDGTDPIFGRYFEDKVAFYGNPYFRRGSYETNSWLISMNGAHESKEKKRHVYPDYWCFFNGDGTTKENAFDRNNMVNTGMKFKPGVVYRFAVAVYPQKGEYNAAIRDDERTVVHTGLKFRNKKSFRANAVHFGVGAKDENSDASFSLDSVCIEQLSDGAFGRCVERWE